LARNKKARRIIAGVVKFVISMIVMTIICFCALETFVDNKNYNCTDDNGGYLIPGDWVLHSFFMAQNT